MSEEMIYYKNYACADFYAHATKFLRFESMALGGQSNPLMEKYADKCLAVSNAEVLRVLDYDEEVTRSGFYCPIEFVGKLQKDSIAVVRANGVMIPGSMPMGVANLFGFLPIQNLTNTLSLLVESHQVKAIVIQFDSPGGELTQMSDAYSEILEMAKQKPIIAFAGDMAASGGFFLACACREIYMSPTGTVGSIGSMTISYDASRAIENAGYLRIIETNQDATEKVKNLRTAKGLTRMVTENDRAVEFFHYIVAKFLGITIEEVVKKYGSGRTFVGTEAVDSGIITGIKLKTELISEIEKNLLEGRKEENVD